MKTVVTGVSVIVSLLFISTLLISTIAMADSDHRRGQLNSRKYDNRGYDNRSYDNRRYNYRDSQSETQYRGRPSRWGYSNFYAYTNPLNPRNFDRYSNRWGNSRPYDNRSNGSYSSSDQSWIREGVRDGRLSSAEVNELRQDQREIRQQEARYLQDGRLTQKERESLEDRHSDYRAQLEHELNDGERRWK